MKKKSIRPRLSVVMKKVTSRPARAGVKRTKSAASRPDFAPVFAALKAIVKPYEPRFRVVQDTPQNYILETEQPVYRNRPLWLGGVRTGKAYVSYHLMTVYMFPDLARTISPALRKRMQGKSCFNFTQVDESLFRELSALTAAGLKKFRTAKHRLGNPT